MRILKEEIWYNSICDFNGVRNWESSIIYKEVVIRNGETVSRSSFIGDGETKTKIMGVVTVVLVLGTAQVAQANLVDSNSIIQDGIEYYIQTDKFVYDLGENVEMLFRVTNLGDTTIIIPCTRSGEFNLWVQKDNETIWALAHWFVWYSPGVEFDPGESKELTYTWDMEDDNGKLVTPGIYDVVGVMYTGPTTEVKVPITIIPEPSSLALLGLGLVRLLVHNKKNTKHT